MDLKNKSAVVTGAGSGIGRSLAQKLAAAGARRIVCADLDLEGAEKTAASIGDIAIALKLDVADHAAIDQLVADEEHHGGIDVFVSNAGYAKGGGLSLDAQDWQKMMDVHMWSHLYAAQAVIPKMIERGGGYILNTSSAAGLLTQIDSGAYAVSKHASVAFAEWLSINYAERGIGVSVLCPQAVRTKILGKSNKTVKKPESNQAANDGILEPDFVADCCLTAIEKEAFLVLPHPEVAKYFRNKANDYERWLNGMRRFRARLFGAKKPQKP